MISTLISVIAVVVALAGFVRQELVTRTGWRKSNTFALFQMWNSEEFMRHRGLLWDYFDRNEAPTFYAIRNNSELSLAFNRIAHFFVETAVLQKEGYLDEKICVALFAEPANTWSTAFKKIAAEAKKFYGLEFGKIIAAIEEVRGELSLESNSDQEY